MISIRGGSGLGDSLYLQGVVRHFVERGHRVEACSDWPDVFRHLRNVKVSKFRRLRVQVCAHYTIRKGLDGTDQWQDCCIQAGINVPVEFRLDWKPVNQAIVDLVRSLPGPRIIVGLPRIPLGRSDGVGRELLPDCRRIQQAIDLVGPRASFIQVGSGKPEFSLSGLTLDLVNKTSVTDLIDAAFAGDAFLGYVSFLVPLAESLQKPAMFVWSRSGLETRGGRDANTDLFFRQITPKKILHRKPPKFSPASRAVIDDCSDDEMREAVNAFFDEAGSSAEVRR